MSPQSSTRTRRRRARLVLGPAILSAALSLYFALPHGLFKPAAAAVDPTPAVFTVNSPNDADDLSCDANHCSLREAIKAANAETGTLNTIAFNIHNLLVNPNCEDALASGNIPGWTETTGQWTQRAGPGGANDPIAFGGRAFFGPEDVDQATAELTQEVDVSAYAAEIDSVQGQKFEFTGYVRSFPQSPPDLSRIRVEYADAASVVLDTFDSGNIGSTTRWVPVNDTRAAPSGTRKIQVRLTSTRVTGINNNSYYDALSLRAVGRTDQPQAALTAIGPTNTPAAWPAVTDPVVINGTTQPTYISTPVVELNGDADTAVLSGLVISAGGSTVRGLCVTGFTDHGIDITTAGGNLVVGNHLGLDPTGTLRKGNTEHGVILRTSGNTVGGAAAADRNVISGNTIDGVRIFSAGVTGTVIKGNYIGTDVSGTLDIGNNRHGVFSDTTGGSTVIGGSNAGEGNVISGNAQQGILISGGSNNVIQGNRIGTDKTGALDLGNGLNGVLINNNSDGNDIGGTSGVTVGGPCTGACNVISGNGTNGVEITGNGTSSNEVKGNYLGTDVTGMNDLGNNERGVDIVGGASANSVGGTSPEDRNIISGNNITGVTIDNADNNTVQGNYIGTKVNGSSALPNLNNGVGLNTGSEGNLVGGTSGVTPGGACTGACNVLSGNDNRGVQIFNTGTSANPNKVQGNLIGTDASGTSAVANASGGVLIDAGSDFNLVGGTAPEERNVISGNTGSGVQITGGGGGQTTSSSNRVEGNYIGTKADGATALPNSAHGVLINSSTFAATNNTVGGASGASPGACSGACNVIAFNSADGVYVQSASATGNTVRNNSVHSNGDLGVDLGTDGVTANDYDDPATSPANETDADAGANNLQNFPDLTSSTSDGGSTTVTGSLASLAGTYTLEFFSQSSCDSSGHGEGETYLGSASVVLASAGAQTFTAGGLAPVAPGQRITATATNAAGSTSEFSSCVTDIGVADVRIMKKDAADPVPLGGSVTYTLRAYNDGPHEAHNVVVTDPLPVGLSAPTSITVEGDYTGAGCSYDATPRTVVCNLGTMRVFDNTYDGEIKKGKVFINITTTAQQLGLLTNTPTIDADEPDPDTSDNTGRQKTTVLGVSSVDVTPDNVPGGASCQQARVKVTLSGVTPADVFIELFDDLHATTNIEGSASPSLLRIPQGESSGTLLVQTSEVSSAQAGTVTARYGASSSASDSLTVRPVGLKKLSVSPATVNGGDQSSADVFLECPAGPSGVAVTLTTGKPSVAKFINPATNAEEHPLVYTFGPGASEVSITVQTYPVNTSQGVNVRAAANGTEKNVRLQVNAP